MFEEKDEIKARLKASISYSSKDTLQYWRAPFLHTGGAGTFYPLHDISDIEHMPKFQTPYSMGPFSSRITEVQDLMQDSMRCNIPGYEGDFFDANDGTYFCSAYIALQR